MIEKVLFPLGNFNNKEEIREVARKHNLEVANKPDSQEICFVPDNDYVRFLKENSNIKSKPGNIVDKEGKILGKHKGLISYTIGQRKGLGISSKNPLYVIKLDKEKNEVIVGEEKDIFLNELLAEDINYTLDIKLDKEINIQAKVRYNSIADDAILYPIDNNKAKIVFDKPQRAITSGQSVVFYIGDILLRRRKNNMRNQRGVTLVSLAIYLVLIIIVLAILATVTANFQSNIKDISEQGMQDVEINKFNMYFLQEVKKSANSFTIEDGGSKVSFATGNIYEYSESYKSIYLKNSEEGSTTIKIASNIKMCLFKQKIENGKTIINVTIQAEEGDIKYNQYVLNNEQDNPNYQDEDEYVFGTSNN